MSAAQMVTRRNAQSLRVVRVCLREFLEPVSLGADAWTMP